MTGTVELRREDGVAWVRLTNPGKRNAFTWGMYDELERVTAALAADEELRAVFIRGTPEDGFAAGTEIDQFADFRTGEDGMAYERRVARVLQSLADVAVPVVSLVEGAAVGAGLAVAVWSDVVVAERTAVFGAPIARTLGNCLPAELVRRMRDRLGPPVADTMLLTAALVPAGSLTSGGFVSEVVEPGGLDGAAQRLATQLRRAAPRTVRALKATSRRLDATRPTADNDDLIRACYGSADFAEGVRAFLAHEHPVWTGR
ncbi:enoyl-CoA hydratase [Cellulomonas sp. KRMCY2]|uniref:enoyl-CoA hydratase n=1 Tax=Cellulomonas sp. KRMCY2 TaxID=1304865 RepID=UPI00045E8D9A|nr:enoyl-CoA hydratase [Cellulomonas sp. KRMCY2]